MSRIVSPHPPARFTIEIDKQTGAASFTPSEPIDFLVIIQAFAAITLQMVQEHIKAKTAAAGDAKTSGNPFENPFGNPQENPQGNKPS